MECAGDPTSSALKTGRMPEAPSVPLTGCPASLRVVLDPSPDTGDIANSGMSRAGDLSADSPSFEWRTCQYLFRVGQVLRVTLELESAPRAWHSSSPVALKAPATVCGAVPTADPLFTTSSLAQVYHTASFVAIPAPAVEMPGLGWGAGAS